MTVGFVDERADDAEDAFDKSIFGAPVPLSIRLPRAEVVARLDSFVGPVKPFWMYFSFNTAAAGQQVIGTVDSASFRICTVASICWLVGTIEDENGSTRLEARLQVCQSTWWCLLIFTGMASLGPLAGAELGLGEFLLGAAAGGAFLIWVLTLMVMYSRLVLRVLQIRLIRLFGEQCDTKLHFSPWITRFFLAVLFGPIVAPCAGIAMVAWMFQ